jgi:hypothetical protein
MNSGVAPVSALDVPRALTLRFFRKGFLKLLHRFRHIGRRGLDVIAGGRDVRVTKTDQVPQEFLCVAQ